VVKTKYKMEFAIFMLIIMVSVFIQSCIIVIGNSWNFLVGTFRNMICLITVLFLLLMVDPYLIN